MAAAGSTPQPVREQWGVFALEEGLRLWVRVMIPFTVPHEGPAKVDQLRVSTVVVTEASMAFKGTPSGNPVDFRTAKPVKEYDQVRVVTPCESIYLLPSHAILTVRLDPVKVRRYADFAPDGDPIVQLDNIVQIQAASPPGGPQLAGLAIGAPPSPLPPPVGASG